jgi:hypothetical protein
VWRGSSIRSQESSRSRPSASSLFSLRSLMIPSDSSQGMISSSNVPYSAVAKVCRMPAPTQLPPSSTVAARHCLHKQARGIFRNFGSRRQPFPEFPPDTWPSQPNIHAPDECTITIITVSSSSLTCVPACVHDLQLHAGLLACLRPASQRPVVDPASWPPQGQREVACGKAGPRC